MTFRFGHAFCALLVLALGCSEPRRAPTKAEETGGVAAATVQRHTFEQALARFALLGTWSLPDRGDALVMAGPEGVVVWDISKEFRGTELWRGPGNGGASAIVSGDADGDGDAELLVGWGMHPEAMAVPARLELFRFTGGGVEREIIAEWPTPRAQFGGLQAGPPVVASYFVGKYDVRTVALRHGGGSWAEDELVRGRLTAHVAATKLNSSEPMLGVGRPYGTEPKSDGDIYVRVNGTSVMLPSVRGVRSAAWVRVGPSEREMLCYGAGWHWRYREQAKGVLTCAWPTHPEPTTPERWNVEVVDTVGAFEVSQIDAADLDGDGAKELVVRTPNAAVAYRRGSDEGATPWVTRVLGPCGSSMALGDYDGDGRPEVACANQQVVFYALP